MSSRARKAGTVLLYKRSADVLGADHDDDLVLLVLDDRDRAEGWFRKTRTRCLILEGEVFDQGPGAVAWLSGILDAAKVLA